MSDWQKTLHQSVDSLDKLKAYVTERFGAEAAEREIDVAALQPAFDNFQMRITPAALDLINEPGDPMWNQYVPTMQELDIVDGVIDRSEEHTSELQSQSNLVCRLLLEKKKNKKNEIIHRDIKHTNHLTEERSI